MNNSTITIHRYRKGRGREEGEGKKDTHTHNITQYHTLPVTVREGEREVDREEMRTRKIHAVFFSSFSFLAAFLFRFSWGLYTEKKGEGDREKGRKEKGEYIGIGR